MKQISNKEYEKYQQYQTDKLHGRILTPDDSIRTAIDYMEEHLEDNISALDVFSPVMVLHTPYAGSRNDHLHEKYSGIFCGSSLI